jgi:hypothetical protein
LTSSSCANCKCSKQCKNGARICVTHLLIFCSGFQNNMSKEFTEVQSSRVIEFECSGGNRKLADFASSGVTHSLDEEGASAHATLAVHHHVRVPSETQPQASVSLFFTSKIPSIQCHIYQMDSRTNLLRPMHRFSCKVAFEADSSTNFVLGLEPLQQLQFSNNRTAALLDYLFMTLTMAVFVLRQLGWSGVVLAFGVLLCPPVALPLFLSKMSVSQKLK